MHTRSKFSLFITAVFLVLSTNVISANAQDTTTQEKAKQVWQVLDYLAVDYGAAVQNGVIVSKDEYGEMQEFSANAEKQLSELPKTDLSAKLVAQAGKLRNMIAAKASPNEVGNQARSLAAEVLKVYPVPLSPTQVPDLKKGGALYQANCASCHGAAGNGDGPLAKSLNPPPIALSDKERAKERSVFSLQQIISHGVAGTSMPSFAQLSEDDRWAIAFFASTMSYTDADRAAGKKSWTENKSLHNAVPNINALTQATESGLEKQIASSARPILAHLRSEPGQLMASNEDSLALAKKRLSESVQALQAGDKANASRLALSAYLDGFEIAEPALAAKNKELFNDLEKGMGAFRAIVNRGQLDEAKNAEQQLQVKLTQAQDALTTATDDPLATFLGAFTILLREGLEALLVVVAMVAFLKKADRRDVLVYVHAGWVVALAGGVVTWAVATYLVDLSGASREMTEGFSAIFAAVVLLGVGIWMHQKSMAGRWQAYVRDKLSSALNRRSAMMLFLLSFVTVYREVFETVLFYAALWTGGNGGYMLLGMGAAILILAVVAFVLLRTSARLPIGKFFAASSALVAILAFVMVGKGVAALQKVGVFEISTIPFPQIELLGIYPTTQTVVAQMLIVMIVIASVIYNIRSAKK
ncbi:cytochrome c/FTR1 family iron permease [Herminiimonas contaminans]|uniref:Cytochrome c/FTR1 family iron permease n=1 Tax=Herminiimonas contaminans TaxID=1111140 RepID=A0ABS0EY52_9BURK|nr:cytochrome c/FTR1 family iron permease [Herminiimonas contaminans]MBF8179745.1 cytochrome c/FTR1 family iron permease [Herminiimonas contaminans]